MITRRASEIIRLAVTMSQVQNTDALSWRDKIDMLNQSYIRLYDDINNSGDLFYSKEVVFEPDIIDRQRNTLRLPKDFWKLLLVGYRGTWGEIIPIERAPNAGQFFSGYRIINNELFFSNFFVQGPLVIRYIPQPQTISYPLKAYRLPGGFTQAAYDSIDDTVILAKAGMLTIIDRAKGVALNKTVEDNFIIAVSAGILYIVKETGIYCFDYELNQLSSYEGTFDLYAHSIGWERGIIVSTGGKAMKYVSGGQPEESEDYWNFMDGRIIKSDTGTDRGIVFIYIDSQENLQDITGIFNDADSFVIADPYIYINAQGKAIVYENLEKTDIVPAVVGGGVRKGAVLAAEINNETGYGVIFHDFYSGLNFAGFAADTAMNYPQNIFFDWLIADLAVKFRVALDMPSGELPALADDYHDTLMKGLSRDAYMTQRINNAYGKVIL